MPLGWIRDERWRSLRSYFLSQGVGAALAPYLGVVARDSLDDYTVAFLTVGILAILAALLASRINREPLSPVPARWRP